MVDSVPGAMRMTEQVDGVRAMRPSFPVPEEEAVLPDEERMVFADLCEDDRMPPPRPAQPPRSTRH